MQRKDVLSKVKLGLHLVRNMGWRYVAFRVLYEIRRRTGLLKKAFPVSPPSQRFIPLADWRLARPAFFFGEKADLTFPKKPSDKLKKEVRDFREGRFTFFHATPYDLGKDYDWVTNPSTGYRYDVRKHWTEIPDFTQEAGDIKYVWEKSRFSYLYDLIRYDYHVGEDLSREVFAEIESWMEANPINQGPNYRCSQEISLRVLNWTFALYYYAASPVLTEALFQKILHFIYWQLKHVRANIHFSRISVRNNHAITETLMLYLAGLLFPFFPEAKKWKAEGKRWLETEIAYQIYPDGTYLQFSHNYHRVVVQLLTWAFYLSELHGERFSEVAYGRARKTLRFLTACQNEETGYLPNYGANDGALFFPWNDCAYRDYRPQLNALYYYFNRQHLYEEGPWREDVDWLRARFPERAAQGPVEIEKKALQAFPEGGFYVIRDAGSLTCIRCGTHKDRPAQADNLHLDVWVGSRNILRDAGSYLYNTDAEWIRYFNGSRSHNTATLGDFDQMYKGPRFIWMHWTQAQFARLEEAEEAFVFDGSIQAFRHLAPGIMHRRRVRKKKGEAHWEVEDQMAHATGLPLRQYWNLGPDFERLGFSLQATDADGRNLEPQVLEGYFSEKYGILEPARALRFETPTQTIRTTIEIR